MKNMDGHRCRRGARPPGRLEHPYERHDTIEGLAPRGVRSETPMRALVIAVLALSVAVGARAQIPDTPAGRQLTAWLAAFNNPDGQALRHFLEVNAPDRLPQIERAFDLRARTGGLEVKKVDEAGAARVRAPG